jgi:hypothetical protein
MKYLVLFALVAFTSLGVQAKTGVLTKKAATVSNPASPVCMADNPGSCDYTQTPCASLPGDQRNSGVGTDPSAPNICDCKNGMCDAPISSASINAIGPTNQTDSTKKSIDE